MTWLLIVIIVLNPAHQPVKGAWVEVEGMYKSGYIEEQTTDSRGHFVAAVEKGQHRIAVMKEGYVVYEGEFNTEQDTVTIVLQTAGQGT